MKSNLDMEQWYDLALESPPSARVSRAVKTVVNDVLTVNSASACEAHLVSHKVFSFLRLSICAFASSS